MKPSTLSYFFIITFLSLLLFIPISLRPFHSRGEPREALVAVSMIKTGNYVLPQRTDGEYATKPPMLHWLMLVASNVLGGLDEFSARSPSIVAAIICNILLFILISDSLRASAGLLGVLLLSTSAVWFRCATAARVDMVLSLFVMSALISYYFYEKIAFSHTNSSNSNYNIRKTLLLFCVVLFLAFATLTKGPAFIVLPATIIFLYNLSNRRSLIFSTKSIVLVALSAGLLAATWYLLAYLQGGSTFLSLVYNENIARLTGNMEQGDDPHEHNVFYLLGSYLIGLFPWSLIVLIPLLIMLFKDSLNKIKYFRINNFLGLAPEIKLSLITCFCFVLFYSIPASKRAEYLIPCYPFTVLLMLHAINSVIPIKYTQKTNHFFNIFLLIVFSLKLVIFALFYYDIINTNNSQMLQFMKLVDQKQLIIILSCWIACIFITYITFKILAEKKIKFNTNGIDYYCKTAIAYYIILLFISSFILAPLSNLLSAKQFTSYFIDPHYSKLPIFTSKQEYALLYYGDGRVKELISNSIQLSQEFLLVTNNSFLYSKEGKQLIPDGYTYSKIAERFIEKPRRAYELLHFKTITSQIE